MPCPHRLWPDLASRSPRLRLAKKVQNKKFGKFFPPKIEKTISKEISPQKHPLYLVLSVIQRRSTPNRRQLMINRPRAIFSCVW